MSHGYKGVSFAMQKRLVQLLRNVFSYTIGCVLILICLVSASQYVLQGLSLFRLDEAGYGDSYILYDVLHFQKTGTIYRDLADPPYLPAQYSPLVYILYSLPGRIASWENPFVAPRFVPIAAFLACIALIVSIVRVLFPSGLTWLWGLFLPFSTRITPDWVLQLRADIPGISLGLLSIRFLLSESRWAVPLAAVCAGLALQLKITFIAAASAGFVWLTVQRRWKDVARFFAIVTVVSLGPYLLYSLREPRMIPQMLSLSPGVINIAGNLGLIDQVVTELVMLLTVVGLASIEWRTLPKETLLTLYVATSFTAAAMTAMQAGAAQNYYLEMLFACVPIAVLGVTRLMELVTRITVLGPVLTIILVIHFLVPASTKLYYEDSALLRKGWVETGNDELLQLSRSLVGSRIFSTFPRLALLDSDPLLTEPYLLSYLHRLGKVDLEPFIKPLERNDYEVVITYDSPISWRNVSQLDPDLRSAIAGSYRPHCTFHQGLFHLPNGVDPASSTLAAQLRKIGCSPVSDEGRTKW